MNSLGYSVEHFGLPSRNPEALAAWYCRVLEGREVWRISEQPPAIFVALPSGLILEIYPTEITRPETADNRTAGWRHLALRVPQLEVAQEELSRRGVVWKDPIKPAGGGGRIVFFADLDGNLLHLVDRPSTSALA